jgi:hypothetical protein
LKHNFDNNFFSAFFFSEIFTHTKNSKHSTKFNESQQNSFCLVLFFNHPFQLARMFTDIFPLIHLQQDGKRVHTNCTGCEKPLFCTQFRKFMFLFLPVRSYTFNNNYLIYIICFCHLSLYINFFLSVSLGGWKLSIVADKNVGREVNFFFFLWMYLKLNHVTDNSSFFLLSLF